MKPKATIKAYPIKEQQKKMEHWADGQEVKRFTVRLVIPPTQPEMDILFKQMVDLGFGSLDKQMFVQDIQLSKLPDIQKQLLEILDLTYLVA